MRFKVEVHGAQFAIVDTNNNYVIRSFYVREYADAYCKKLNEDDANASRNDSGGQPS